MPETQWGFTKTVVLGTNIYVIRWPTVETPWADVFDTVAGRWESLPSVKLRATNQMGGGCAIRGGKVCVWVAGEELRFDPETKTWERLIEWFDERIGEWKKLKFVNKGFRSHWRNIRMSNVGGRLAIMGSAVLRSVGNTVGVWYMEIEVKKDEDGDFRGEVLWSEMVHSTCRGAGTSNEASERSPPASTSGAEVLSIPPIARLTKPPRRLSVESFLLGSLYMAPKYTCTAVSL
ncbi:hypothetical protein TIFTF001_004177 [Ficus carica]|uniref:F-box/kelch-repeat protein n=1 Tax=Ficus carica TaxID=3494 RepID=A0AA88CWR5_FICCA|nr:hypothetical protein TIFTF001_004177 [Ficus carica]